MVVAARCSPWREPARVRTMLLRIASADTEGPRKEPAAKSDEKKDSGVDQHVPKTAIARLTERLLNAQRGRQLDRSQMREFFSLANHSQKYLEI